MSSKRKRQDRAPAVPARFNVTALGLWLNRLEWVAAGIITLLALSLHLTVLSHAGPLWRDETNTVALAAMPRISDIWANLPFDSFPMLWIMILRIWGALGPGSDFSFRLLGFLVGVGILGALWFQARRMNAAPPLFSLVLAGLNSALIVWGGTMRAYGFGALLILLAFIAIWNASRSPTRMNIVLAVLFAVGGVQTLYHDAALLFAVGISAAIFSWRHDSWKRMGWPLGIGLLAGLSLLPYLGVMKRGAEVNMPLRIPDYGPAKFWEKLSGALGDSVVSMTWVWLSLAGLAIILCLWCQIFPAHWRANPQQKNSVLYCGLVLVFGAGSYYAFLHLLSYPTKVWYYIALLPIMAAALEPILGLLGNRIFGRIFRLLAVAVLAGIVYWPAMKAAQFRRTNVDLVAAHLNGTVSDKDFVLVVPWYFGVSFQRYYHGSAGWLTLPPLGPQKLHRYDLVREKMMMEDQDGVIQPLLDKARESLQAGHVVWVAGMLESLDPGQRPPTLAPAPHSQYRWNDNAYTTVWSMHVARFLQEHALKAETIKLSDNDPVGWQENVSLIRVEGWRQ